MRFSGGGCGFASRPRATVAAPTRCFSRRRPQRIFPGLPSTLAPVWAPRASPWRSPGLAFAWAFWRTTRSLAGLARANLLENGLTDRGSVVEADLLSRASRRAAGLDDESAGLVISNPPFLDPGRARLSPDPRKRRAHVMPAAGPAALAAWIAAAMALLAPGGLVILIHRPDALPVILETLAGRAGGITVLPVYPRRQASASRILVRGKKGSRAPLAIAPPLVLHDREGFTPAAEAIHKGAAAIEW